MSRPRFRREVLRSSRGFTRFRQLRRDGHRVLVGWTGQKPGRAVEILHPVGENPARCLNPPQGVPQRIYAAVEEIRATKGTDSAYPGEKFKHRFTSQPEDWALPDGTTIVTPGGTFRPADGSALLTTRLVPVNGRNPRPRRRRR